MKMEVVMVHFKMLYQNLLGKPEENTEIHSEQTVFEPFRTQNLAYTAMSTIRLRPSEDNVTQNLISEK
jgi:hypothetical protein